MSFVFVVVTAAAALVVFVVGYLVYLAHIVGHFLSA
jgi:hypothetical protein